MNTLEVWAFEILEESKRTIFWWNFLPFHTVAIWPFTFHKKSGFACVVDFEGQFQTSLQAESINFLISKFKYIILIFLLFFAGIVKSTAFCTLSLLFQKGWSIWVMFLCQITTPIFQLLWTTVTVCKKHWICKKLK